MEKILSIIFRRKTINSILFILVAATIRELAAIGASEEIIEFCNKIQEQNPDNFLYYVALIIEFVFGKGSLITLFVLIGLIMLFSILKIYENKEPKANPRLEIELEYRGAMKKPLRPSRNNPINEQGHMIIEQGKGIYINELEWKYNMIIRNNSSYPAYKPKIIFPKSNKYQFSYIEKLNSNKPIKALEETTLTTKYSYKIEALGKDAADMVRNKMPANSAFDEMRIVLEYENENGRKFYTNFQVSEGSNTHSNRKPK